VGESAAVLELAGIYRRLVGARIRADWQYRLSFVLYTLGQFLVTFLDFAVILVLFGLVPSLAGWSLAEVAFLYGTTGVAFNLADTFASQVERCSAYIRLGTFDTLLVRPLGPLFQLSCREFELRRIGKVLQALAVLAVAVAHLPVAWTPSRVAVTVGFIASGTVIFASLWVVTSAISFWTVETQEVANSVTYGGNLITQYPVDVFAPWLRRLLLIVPLAFVNYLPAVWILGREDALGLPSWAGLTSPLVAAATVVVARAVWGAAIRHYRSTGS
jgi:ABC-2 type transport system permease protein